MAARTDAELEIVTAEAVLRGTLRLPRRSRALPALVVAHGARLGLRDARVYVELAEIMGDEGIAVLRYDRRGEGASTGDGDTATPDVLAADLGAWVRLLQEHPEIDGSRVGVWGISQGGWLMALAAASDPSIACVVAVSAPGAGPTAQMEYAVSANMRAAGYDEPAVRAALAARRVVNQWEDGFIEGPAAQAALDALRGQPWFEMAYLGDLSEHLREVDATWSHLDVRPALAAVSAPVLLFYGDRDRWVDPVESPTLWRHALPNSDVTVVRLAGAGHMPTLAADPDSIDPDESGPTHPEYVARLRTWARSVLLA